MRVSGQQDPLWSLLAPVDREVVQRLRREWDWVVPEALDVRAITVMGDWLFQDELGAVFMLETTEATVSRVAGSVAELRERVGSRETRDGLFLEGLAIGTLGERALPRNHCVGFKIPPILGGPTDVSNLAIVAVEAYQVWTSRVQRAFEAVPPGKQITGVDLDEDGTVSMRWR